MQNCLAIFESLFQNLSLSQKYFSWLMFWLILFYLDSDLLMDFEENENFQHLIENTLKKWNIVWITIYFNQMAVVCVHVIT